MSDRAAPVPELEIEVAEERLGRRLFEELEGISQTREIVDWNSLSGSEQSLYILSVTATIGREAASVLRILADEGIIDGSTQIGEKSNFND